MKRKTFKEIEASVRKPKELLEDTILPYVFDLHWDCKTFGELRRLGLNLEMKRLLAEAGYNVAGIR